MPNIMPEASAVGTADTVEKFRSGDLAAIDALCHYLRRYLLRKYKGNISEQDAEDLASEAVITAWKDLETLRDRDRFRAWLCGIAVNLTNRFRDRRDGVTVRASTTAAVHSGELVQPQRPGPRETAFSSLEAGGSFDPLPDDDFVEDIIMDLEIKRVLSTLTDREAAAAQLVWIEEYSYQQAAGHLGTTRDGIGKALMRAKDKLQALYRKENAARNSSTGHR